MPPRMYDQNHWDEGTGLAIVTGAAIGAAVASSDSSSTSGSSSPEYVASPPCSAPMAVAVGSTTYYQCGSSWFTEGYGPNGPAYVAVAPPPGY